ncbi:MAG TPA: YcxB family protein [Candidatus Acidoferrales bacterium]|nr:YcxB family protein [Candidatus Acidoferrales bacterium]
MEPTPDVIVEINLRPSDIYTPFQWDRANVSRWVCAAVLSWIFYDLYNRSSETLLSFSGGRSIMVIVVLLMALVLFGLLLFPYLRVRANFREFPKMKILHRVTFGATGVGMWSEDSNTDCKWSVFERVVETRTVFAFTYSTGGAIYVPKRCFAARDDILRLREIIRANLPEKWHLRRD